MNVEATLANAAWFAASIPEWLRYRQAASNVEKTQNQLLAHYLRQNAVTEFGKAHDFERIRDWGEYTERVPIRTYDDFHPWIERIAKGSPGVLTAERVDLLEPSSGSSGPEKWVPMISVGVVTRSRRKNGEIRSQFSRFSASQGRLVRSRGELERRFDRK